MALVELTMDNAVARVVLNRPDKLNALNFAMFQQLDKVRRQLLANRSLRAVIISGEGNDFCSGLDVKSVMSNRMDAIRLLWKWRPGAMNLAQRVAVGWRQLPVPVIAAIQGRCWGGGMQIALGCDFRIADPDATLAIMEAKWGLIPDMGGTLALNALLPVDLSMKLAMTAEPVAANDAVAMGLITEMNNEPLSRAMELAEQLMQRSPDTQAAIKRLYYGAASSASDSRILRRETGYQIKILLGKNQSIAAQRELGKIKRGYFPRLPW
jgi:enoyl-CoA hydratase/carnithine racemase